MFRAYAPGRHGLTDAAQIFNTPEIRLLSARLEAELANAPRFGWPAFDAACRDAAPKMQALPFGPQIDYLAAHRKRFFELDNLVGSLTASMDRPAILDVGMSINTIILSHLMPDAAIAVADRPDVKFAFDQPYTLFNVNLTDYALDEVDLKRSFDIILFAEVLEHLLANPVRVFSFLIRHLSERGSLIVTTPNFFSGHNRAAMERLENPQPIFPHTLKPGEENQFHIREYSMSELLLLAAEAGGRPSAFFYSAVWDEVLPPAADHRSNLCAVIRRGEP